VECCRRCYASRAAEGHARIQLLSSGERRINKAGSKGNTQIERENRLENQTKIELDLHLANTHAHILIAYNMCIAIMAMRIVTGFCECGNEFLDLLCGLVVLVPGCISPMSRVLLPALPDFLRSNGSGTGPTQLRSYWE
jgi:hypothetical protein